MKAAVQPTHNFTYAGATANVYHANKGEGIPMHQHDYSHATVCVAGSLVARRDGREKVLDKFSQPVDLPANDDHELEALEDGTVFINIFHAIPVHK